MRLADAVLSRLVLIRVVPGLVILLYLFVVIASHSVPMSSAFGVPLAGAGIFTIIIVVFVTALRQFARKGLIIPPPRRWSGFVHLAFVATVGEETDHRTGPCPT